MGGIETACEDIPDIDDPICTCPECVQEMQFMYTGALCELNQVLSGKCTQNSPNAYEAGYRITDALDPTLVLGTGQAKQQDTITIRSPNGCIPDTLAVTLSFPTGAVTQTFVVDAQCDGGRGLILLEDYGAFQFTGYTCDANSVYNCLQEVSYDLNVCNYGTEDETVYEMSLSIKETESGTIVFQNLIENVPLKILCYLLENVTTTQEKSMWIDVSRNHTVSKL